MDCFSLVRKRYPKPCVIWLLPISLTSSLPASPPQIYNHIKQSPYHTLFYTHANIQNSPNTRGDPPNLELSSGGWAPCRWALQEPICISGPAGIVVRGCIQLQWFFIFGDSLHWPISWWVIYEHACPHFTECSGVLDQKWHDPHVPPSLFTWSQPEWLFFCFAGWKKFSKGNILWYGRGEMKNKQTNAETLKGIKIDRFKTHVEQWKKGLHRCIASNGECFEDDWRLNM